MDRAPHERRPCRTPLAQRVAELERIEAAHPRPERDVRIARHLGLQADQPPDRVEDTDASPAKQHLAFQQRAVQRSAVQDDVVAACRHGADAIAYRSGTYVVISTPVEVVTDSASLSGFFGSSRKSLFPLPRTIGMIISAYSSTRSFS